MSSILRKAMWPGLLVAGMLTLLGAIGTATAPKAFAADGQLCITDDGTSNETNGTTNTLGIQGPFPNYDGYGDVQDHNLLLLNYRYLFAIVVEDVAIAGTGIDVSVDDEEGDADIEEFGATPAPQLPPSPTCLAAASTTLTRSANALWLTWGAVGSAFRDDLDDDWDVPTTTLAPNYYNFTAAYFDRQL